MPGKDKNQTKENIIFCAAVFLLGLMGLALRLAGIDHVGGDMVECLIPWYEEITPVNGIHSLQNYTGNYGMPYITILWFLHFIPGETYIKIKAVSVIFEYVCAIATGLLSSHFFKDKSKKYAFITGFGLTIIYPTLVINGAWAGQCDGIYTSFVILMIYAFFRNKPALASVFLGCAFAFKFQTIFILPFLVLFFYRRRIFSLLNLLLVPLTVEILYIPAITSGYSPLSPITIYLSQSDFYPQMYMYYPGLWSFFWKWSDYGLFHIPVILWLITAYACLFLVLLYRRRDMEDSNWIETAFLTALMAVYFLPSMHERYGIIAEILAVVYATIHPKRSWMSAFLWATIIWTAIQPMFFGRFPEHMIMASGMMLVLIALVSFLAYDLHNDKTADSGKIPESFRFRSEKITRAEEMLWKFTDKYIFLIAIAIISAGFMYSAKCLMSITTPDHLYDLIEGDANHHTALYMLYIRLLYHVGLIAGKETYFLLKVGSAFSMIIAALIWTAVLYFRNKAFKPSFCAAFLILPTTCFYSLIGARPDGISLALTGLGFLLISRCHYEKALLRYCIPAGAVFGLAIALSPSQVLFIAIILLIDRLEGHTLSRELFIKTSVTALVALIISVLMGPAVNMDIARSFASIFLSFTINGAVITPVCAALLFTTYKNKKYLPALLVMEYAALMNIGKYMEVVDEKFYPAIPALTLVSMICLIAALRYRSASFSHERK